MDFRGTRAGYRQILGMRFSRWQFGGKEAANDGGNGLEFSLGWIRIDAKVF
jgi:hypothetical protein